MIFQGLVGKDWQERCNNGGQKVKKVEEDEPKEVLMIFVAETIVYESAVVIKFLNAVLAMSAVESPPRFYHSAIETKVVQVDTLFIS